MAAEAAPVARSLAAAAASLAVTTRGEASEEYDVMEVIETDWSGGGAASGGAEAACEEARRSSR